MTDISLTSQQACPCGSKRKFSQCCDRYISGAKTAPIAEALMRSRYTAYTLGKVDYILATWAEQTRQTVNAADLIQRCKETEYVSLKIISKLGGTRKHTEGQVEFAAAFKSLGKIQTHRELSNFIKQDGQWYYVDGDVSIN
uniref:YchJ-like middle NTF2-like domain-containing protein n=1 Tax=OCS116 cluster bacterium TaxID=2030921 RepID=A0A2A4Z4F6_9PROT